MAGIAVGGATVAVAVGSNVAVGSGVAVGGSGVALGGDNVSVGRGVAEGTVVRVGSAVAVAGTGLMVAVAWTVALVAAGATSATCEAVLLQAARNKSVSKRKTVTDFIELVVNGL